MKEQPALSWSKMKRSKEKWRFFKFYSNLPLSHTSIFQQYQYISFEAAWRLLPSSLSNLTLSSPWTRIKTGRGLTIQEIVRIIFRGLNRVMILPQSPAPTAARLIGCTVSLRKFTRMRTSMIYATG